MKVLIIGSRVPYPLRDGGAIATYNLLKGLSETGVEVDYITLNTKKHFVDKETLEKQFGFLNQLITFDIDTSVKPIPALLNLFQSSSYNITRFINEAFRQLIQTKVNESKYDVIHFEGLFVADYVKGLKTQAPTLLRQHNIEYKIWETLYNSLSIGLKRWYTGLLSRRLERYEKSVTQLFDAVVSITEQDKANTVNDLKYKGHTASIPAGITTSTQIKAPIDYSSVYHIGSMEWLPNQEAMKWFHDSIWPIIESQDKEIKFYMGGKHMPETFRAFEKGKFHVVGEVADLDAFISDKSILAVPLKSGSGIRIKTIEAMMAGKAVVTTSQGAHGLELEHGVHCLIADTADAFAEAVIRLAENRIERDKIAEKGQTYVNMHFGNEAVSKQWKEFYLKLLNQKIDQSSS